MYLIPALNDGLTRIAMPGSVLELSFAIMGGWCAYVLFHRPSVAACGVVLAMVLVEIGARFVDPEATNVAIPLMALLFSAQALRGSIVARTLR